MKRLLIPIVALLAFSMLSTSVSAYKAYYMASFYGEAEGCCWVSTPPAPEPTAGKGSFHIRGLAVVIEELPSWYVADRTVYPNTRLWTRRTHMTASWDSKKLTVWMWPSYETLGRFNDTLDILTVYNMSYFGYYKGAGLEFIMGKATVILTFVNGAEPVSIMQVQIYKGLDLFLLFQWRSGEIAGPLSGCVAKSVIRRVTVWGPIPWNPIPP